MNSGENHGFFERLIWHGGSGIASAVVVLVLQWYLQTNQATATNHESRIQALEKADATTSQAVKDLTKEVDRLNRWLESHK